MEKLKLKKIRIKLEAFDHNILNISCQRIIDKLNSIKIVGPIMLPTLKKIYCVLRSPHVNKDSREHFEIRTHSRILDIYTPEKGIKISLLSLKLPSGVTVTVK